MKTKELIFLEKILLWFDGMSIEAPTLGQRLKLATQDHLALTVTMGAGSLMAMGAVGALAISLKAPVVTPDVKGLIPVGVILVGCGVFFGNECIKETKKMTKKLVAAWRNERYTDWSMETNALPPDPKQPKVR